MKTITRLLFFSILFIEICLNSVTAQTTKTIGSGGNYATLKAAFDAINAGAITGALLFK